MNNKVIIWVIVAIVVIGGAVWYFNRAPGSNYTGSNNNTTTTNQNGSSNPAANGTGRVVFSVTDAAVNMTDVSEVWLKVSKVEARHSLSGWSTVSSTPKTYNLLALNKSKQSIVLADSNLKVGTYDQLRLTIDSVSVKDAKGAIKDAKLPSNVFTTNALLAVSKGNNSSVNFDFIASDSLYTTVLGDYIFAPVVKTQTESSANLTIDANGVVTIASGRVDNTTTMGMDIDGSLKLNFKVDGNQKLQVDANGNIKVDTTVK